MKWFYSKVTTQVEKVQLQIDMHGFKPMPMDLALDVANLLQDVTGNRCRLKQSQHNHYRIERFTGSEWVAA